MGNKWAAQVTLFVRAPHKKDVMHAEDLANTRSPQTPSPSRGVLRDVRTWIVAVLLVAAVLVTYARGVQAAILEPRVDADAVPAVLSPAAALETFANGRWEPLTLLMRSWAGAGGLHAVALTLHGVSTVLLYAVAVLLATLALRRPRPTTGVHVAALVGASLFALHPLRVEPIVWAARSGALLATAATLATVILFARGARTANWGWLAAAVVAYAVAAFAGPWAVGLPIVLVMLDVYPLRRRMCSGRVWVEQIPFLALAATAAVLGCRAATAGAPHVTDAFGRVCYALFFPLRQIVWPLALAPAYSLPDTPGALRLAFYGSLAVIVVLILVAAIVARRGPALAVVIGGYLALLLPTALLLLPAGSERADTVSMLPSGVLMIGLAGGLAALLSAPAWSVRVAGILLTLAGLTAAGLLAVQTQRQCAYWESPVMVWDHAETCQPGVSTWYPRARAHQKLGDVRVAVQLYATVLKDKAAWPELYVHLVQALLETGEFDQAVAQACAGLQRFPQRPELQYALGVALAATGDLAGAQAALSAATAAVPACGRELGHLLMLDGRWADAAAAFALARTALPNDADLAYDEGRALQQAGDVAGARRAFEAALKLQPGHALATRARAALPL